MKMINISKNPHVENLYKVVEVDNGYMRTSGNGWWVMFTPEAEIKRLHIDYWANDVTRAHVQSVVNRLAAKLNKQ